MKTVSTGMSAEYNLLVGDVDGNPATLLDNGGDGSLEDVTATSGFVLAPGRDVVGATAGYSDGDLNLFLTCAPHRLRRRRRVRPIAWTSPTAGRLLPSFATLTR